MNSLSLIQSKPTSLMFYLEFVIIIILEDERGRPCLMHQIKFILTRNRYHLGNELGRFVSPGNTSRHVLYFLNDFLINKRTIINPTHYISRITQLKQLTVHVSQLFVECHIEEIYLLLHLLDLIARDIIQNEFVDHLVEFVYVDEELSEIFGDSLVSIVDEPVFDDVV